jgi:hypothetical protein
MAKLPSALRSVLMPCFLCPVIIHWTRELFLGHSVCLSVTWNTDLVHCAGAPCLSMWALGPPVCDSAHSLPVLIDNLLLHGRSTIKHKFSSGRDCGGRGVRRHIAARSQVGGESCWWHGYHFPARYDGILAKSVCRGLYECCLVCVKYILLYIHWYANVIKPLFYQNKKEI